MIHGSSVAVALADAMADKAVAYKVPADLADDLREFNDRLIVIAMRGSNTKESRDALKAAMIAAVETFAVAVGVAWTSNMQRMEGLGDGEV